MQNKDSTVKPTSESMPIGNALVSRRSECHFRMFGNEEKICSKCRYIIPVTNDDLKALDDTIKSTTEIPKCRQNDG